LPGGWTFQDKTQFIPLQADILAWEGLHFMRKPSTCGQNFKPRISFMKLLEIPGLHKYYDAPSLGRLVEHVRNRPDEVPPLE
jgi:hypothetical protein